MTRIVNVASAQMGPITKAESRKSAVRRLLAMMQEAKSRGAELVVFPELALTSFFPRWVIDDEEELDRWYEREMPGPETAILFDKAKKLEIGFYLGYAELAIEDNRKRRFNTSIIVDRAGNIVGKYRKVHLPGHSEPQPGRRHQHLEKRYFEPGTFGFPVWRAFGGVVGMCICNDRRWPETYRVMGLQGVEMVLLGYNTPIDHTGHADIDGLTSFHNHLSMQAGAYQNSTWVVGTAKCGKEEDSVMIGESVIVAPSGEITAMAVTQEDEVITTRADLDMGKRYGTTIFNFAAHREPQSYRLIVERKGAIPPP
jgi:predicted amidohydrolase